MKNRSEFSAFAPSARFTIPNQFSSLLAFQRLNSTNDKMMIKIEILVLAGGFIRYVSCFLNEIISFTNSLDASSTELNEE
jgi:hypothetical protein